MPNQCTRCGKIYPDASKELLEGCSCGSRFFYYIRQEKFEELQREVKDIMIELEKADKDQIEKDIRELTGLDKKPEEPVILDLESIRVINPGKFEIDIVNLFSKNRPIIYKLGEGKYVIDLASSLKVSNKYKIKDKVFEEYDDLEESEDKDSRDENEIEIEIKDGSKDESEDYEDEESEEIKNESLENEEEKENA